MLKAGTQLGRYRVVGHLGGGGMGQVYRARDAELARDVAIKVLAKEHVEDADLLARFEQEARAVAAVSHPNIVAVYDVGSTREIRFAVMELLEGETLATRLERGALSWESALTYAEQIAGGLAAAHAREIVHRDLKPGNIFLSKPSDVAKILDFGLAKVNAPVLGAELDTIARKTAPGVIVGTIAYMSPEQLRGGPIDHTTDIYSFGAVLYESLTARPPFSRETGADMISAILTGRVDRSIVPSEVPRGLLQIALRCLEKRPQDRFPSCAEILSALAEVRRAGGAGAGAEAAVTTTQTREHPHASPMKSIAVLPFTDMSPAKDLGYFGSGMAEEIINALAGIEGLHVIARTSAFRYEGQDVRTIGDELQVDTVLLGSVRTGRDRVRVSAQLVKTSDGYHIWSERFDREMEDVFAVQDEIAQTVSSALKSRLSGEASPLVTPRTRDPEAYSLYLRGRHELNKRTESAIANSIDHFQRAIAIDRAYAEAHTSIAEAQVLLAVYGVRAPRSTMPEAKAAAEAARHLNPELAQAFGSLGSIYAVHEWNWDRAAENFARALELGSEDPTIRQQYAMNVLIPQRRFQEAETELTRSLERDPVSLTVTTSLGLRFYFDENYGRAEEWFQRALDIERHFGIARFFLALTHAETGAFARAIEEIHLATEATGGSPEIQAALGYAHGLAGNEKEAHIVIEELLKQSEERYVSPSLLAYVHAGLDEVQLALDYLEQSRDSRAADLIWIGVRPVFRRLRGESRFQEIAGSILGER